MRTYHRHLAVRVSPSFVLVVALAAVNMRLWQQQVSISVNLYKGLLDQGINQNEDLPQLIGNLGGLLFCLSRNLSISFS